uniref:ATP synthase subunit a n=1 Tax=Pneumocystis wakefieldiae TaxID=38082 RepID=A0A8A6W4J9_9ASCO|nr:ATP synthase F0 subunit a [Pneumocystis wakefieldiae]QTK22298.1 ATP synthase F0 subunit a [Pneumocystis wakefieldiae]
MTTTIFQSPLEQFEIYTLFSIHLPFIGYNEISITNIGIYFSIIVLILLLWNILTFSNHPIIGNHWKGSQESLYMTVLNTIENQIGSKGYRYFPMIYSIFIFILLSNFIGMIPYSFAVTSHLIFTVSLSMTILLGATLIGLQLHGWNFFSFFIPSGVPTILIPFLAVIEFILYISRGFSLGIRLGANVLAGHMLIKIIAGFIYQIMISGVLLFIFGLVPLLLLIAISGLELAISFIQAYVFIVLTSSYIKDSIYLH